MNARFKAKKEAILAQLNVPEEVYNDLSPKGSIDEGIRSLIHQINQLDGLVTTSSCAGRISVFMEGRRKISSGLSGDGTVEEKSLQEQAGPGGKGGGSWLFVSHDPVEIPRDLPHAYFHGLFGLDVSEDRSHVNPKTSQQLIHIKFEAMILHLLTASLADAQRVLSAALEAGFRESGAVGLKSSGDSAPTPMVAVRSTGLAFDAIIGYQDNNGINTSMVDEAYLRALVSVANDRFHVNAERIERFRSALLGRPHALEREDVEARRQRKRDDGLRRQRATQAEKTMATGPTTIQEGEDFNGIFS